MKVNPVNMTVADYCAALRRKEVIVDPTYQRSSEVWPERARSYLIETILKGFPIPKLTLHQRTNLRTKKTTKYVVDGQQRTRALLDFYDNNLRLSRALETVEARSRNYDELGEDFQQAFLAYRLDMDQFEAASEDDVREYFRRINSFTAPLTAEEERHARFQGEMKWSIYEIAGRYQNVLVNLGVITKKSSIRMADAKLIAEITSALLLGITTTSKTSLDRLYATYDDEFDGAPEVEEAITEAMAFVLSLQAIRSTPLMKTYMFYSLILARIAIRGWETLEVVAPARNSRIAADAENRLLRLADALEDPDTHPNQRAFIEASSERTNVKSQRETRVQLSPKPLLGEPTDQPGCVPPEIFDGSTARCCQGWIASPASHSMPGRLLPPNNDAIN